MTATVPTDQRTSEPVEQAPAQQLPDHVDASALCPRCGAERAVSFGSQLSCGNCGATWQA
jgi:transcription elongation factor Elf1